MVPVLASNRTGREDLSGSFVVFYGNSFIADQTGEIVKECPYMGADSDDLGERDSGDPQDRDGCVSMCTFDLEAIRMQRASWGLFRDRRPTLYRPLLSLDGQAPS